LALPNWAIVANCPDRQGIVSTVATFLYERGANILHADQHRDDESNLFFMRVEWALEDFDLDETSFKEKFGSIAAQFAACLYRREAISRCLHPRDKTDRIY
jgi:formyltetrahydrofolate deformylase